MIAHEGAAPGDQRPANQERVAVIGSGPSGLAAAYRLAEAGYSVTVYERNPIPGGKMRTIHRDGYRIEEGPTTMSSGYTAMLSLAREAGLGDQIIEACAIYGFPRDGRVHTFDAGRIVREGVTTKLLSTATKARLWRLAADCLRYRTALKNSDLVALAEHDDESASEYALRNFGREALDYVVDPTLRGLCSSPPEDLSVLDLLYIFNTFLGIPRAYAFRDGMGSYASALAGRFDTRYETSVIGVEEVSQEVRVSWRCPTGGEQTESFAGCVIAAPADTTREIHVGLAGWSAEFLANVRYTPLVNVNVGFGKKPEGLNASFVLTPTVLVPDLIAIIVEHNRVPGCAPAGKGHVYIGAAADRSRELYDADDDKCVEELVRSAARVIPLSVDDIELGVVSRWTGVSLVSPKGYYRELARFEQEHAARHTRLHLASDYFCTSNINSATAVGERAAHRLAANLGAPRVRIPASAAKPG